MVNYVVVKVNLNKPKGKQLLQGESVKLKLSDNGKEIHVTKSISDKLHSSPKGVFVKLSKALIKKNSKLSGGFLSGLVKAVLPSIASIALPALSGVLKDKIGGLGAEPLYNNDVYNRGRYRRSSPKIVEGGNAEPLYNNDVYNRGRFRRSGKKLIEGGNAEPLYNNDIYNTGRYKRHGKSLLVNKGEAKKALVEKDVDLEMKGEGFFDSILDLGKSGLKALGPAVIDMATNAALKKISGQGKRKSKRKGGSFMPVGSAR